MRPSLHEPRLVVIGGGTGLSVLLKGLKKYTSQITAVVTVSDDGGSSGRLRGISAIAWWPWQKRKPLWTG